MYTLNGWLFLSSGGSYPPVFTVELLLLLLVPPLFIERNSHSYNRTIFVFARATVPY